jgi:hypothetical protein
MVILSSKRATVVGLIAAFGFSLLLALIVYVPSVSAIYPASPSNFDHHAISAKSGAWGPASGSQFNCHPSIYPPGTTGIPQDGGACSTGLDAAETRYKLFARNVNHPGAGQIPIETNLVLYGACRDVTPYPTPSGVENGYPHEKEDHPDKGGRKIKVEIRQTQANGQPGGLIKTVYNFTPGSNPTTKNSGCSGNDLHVKVPRSAFTTNQLNKFGNKYSTALVVVHKHNYPDNIQPGNKLFKLDYGYGYVFGDEDAFFALASGKKGSYSQYDFQFKVDCTYKEQANNGMTLRVRDIDYNTLQAIEPNVYLFNKNATKLLDASDSPYKGQSNFNYDVPDGQVDPLGVYTLRYTAISDNNGLKFGLPYSEFKDYVENDCITVEASSSCQTFEHVMGANSRYRFTVFPRDGSYMNGGPPHKGSTVTGAGNRTWRSFNQAPVYQTQITNDSGSQSKASFNFPELAGPDWIVYVERWQRTNPGSGGTGTYEYGLNDNPTKILNCFSARCESMSIISGALPARPTGVEATQRFRVGVTFRNTGQANLPASTRGYNLTATDPSWVHIQGLGSGIGAGAAKYVEMELDAPPGRTTKNLNVYPDYNGLFALGAACGINVGSYERFVLEPVVNSIVPNDLEDPTRVEMNTSIDQNKDFPYTSVGIPATSTRSLVLKRGAPTIANLIGPHSDSRSFSSPDPYPYDADVYDNTTVPRDFQAADQLCARITISADDGWIGPGNDVVDRDGQPRTAEDCRRVVDRPFVRMYGSDVFAGGQFGSPGAGTGGDIKTYIKRATNVPEGSSYGAGSGVEFAAFALGVIERTADQSEGFTSASLRGASPSAPSGLSFASPGDGFGGNFASTRSVTDYFNATKRPETSIEPGASVNVNSGLADDQQSGFRPPTGAKFRLEGGPNYSRHHSVYVEGDVLITNNITYANSGGWGNLNDIPSFGLFVEGDIYIAANVSQLDGLYVAQPNGDTGGKIYTCANPSNGNLYGESQLYTACRNKLKVNGAFIAQETKLLRTAYTLSDVPVAVNAVPGVPGVGAFSGIDNGSYTYDWNNAAANRAGRSKCVILFEPADPNWPQPSDNEFCYNSVHNLKWYHGGPSGAPAPGEECWNFNNPAEAPAHTWSDNYLCAPAGSNVQLQLVLNGSTPAGKTCVVINELNWAAGEPGGAQPWNNNTKLCYRASVAGAPGTPGQPLQYAKETFANDHAAESFRLAPEMFLSRHSQIPGGGGSGNFDQYLILPPIL